MDTDAKKTFWRRKDVRQAVPIQAMVEVAGCRFICVNLCPSVVELNSSGLESVGQEGQTGANEPTRLCRLPTLESMVDWARFVNGVRLKETCSFN
jgi:hypothetical protein